MTGTLLQHIHQAVLQSGLHMVSAAESGRILDGRLKDDNTLITDLDLESDAILRAALQPIGLPIVSEEDPQSHHLIGTPTDYLIVDPLDGTTSCRRFLGQFGTQVGFGPLVGYVKEGKIAASCFYNVPLKTLFWAEKGSGAWKKHDALNSTRAPERLDASPPNHLNRCAVLFYAGLQGELTALEKLKQDGSIENIYRFGGFANDCSRLAQGFEQIQIQFSVKAWDLPATLLGLESGLEVCVDPFQSKTSLLDWSIQMENPLISTPKILLDEILSIISQK